MDGFKLDIFYREAGINRSTGELAAPRLAEHKKLSGLIHGLDQQENCRRLHNMWETFLRHKSAELVHGQLDQGGRFLSQMAGQPIKLDLVAVGFEKHLNDSAARGVGCHHVEVVTCRVDKRLQST